MTWYAIFETDNGRLVSVGEADAPIERTGLSSLALDARPDLSAVMWDEAARNFVARPAKVVVDRLQDVLTHPAFEDYQQWYNSLNATNKTRLRNLLIWALGRSNRYRSESNTVTETD